MATTTTLRPEASGPPEATAATMLPDRDLASFRVGTTSDERLVDLLAFALAAERRQPATEDGIVTLRQEASRLLSEHAFRYLHNAVDQIRRDAVSEHLGRSARPPGFGTLLLANLLALVVAGLAAFWLALHPATLAGLAGLLSG
ncbi:hypothetical protein [Paracraurococcus lichenis]|uniref:Uncharacterized protein n=1 Tax=Paracraurococcus lichenis TaxID=3064888 RepID=A0ABT9DWH3_9PROT|nr:hypothetical protein [Paracraurococcus sp. LOR1-02]MDO9708239.1 hypothetical protein [Paracraurococcus sp. LOR1-02]